MISQIISHTFSLWYLHQLTLSTLHNKILIENQLITAQIFSLFKSFEEIETLMSNHKSTSYSNEQRLSSTHNTFLKKRLVDHSLQKIQPKMNLKRSKRSFL